MKNNLITDHSTHHQAWCLWWCGLEFEFIKNKKFIIPYKNYLLYPKIDIHNIWITQAHVPTPTLTFSNAPSPRAENSSRSCWDFFKLLHGRFQNFNFHRANLGSPSFTTHSLYLSCTSHSPRKLLSPWAGMSNRWKATLAKRTKLKIFHKQNKHGRQSFLLNFKGSMTSAIWWLCSTSAIWWL